MDADDVGVCDLAGKPQLLPDAVSALDGFGAVLAVDANQLERDGRGKRVVPRMVNDPHAADAEGADDRVAIGEPLAGREVRWRSRVERRGRRVLGPSRPSR